MNYLLRDQRGFTLIEMAVVIVIVGMLMGIGSAMVTPLRSLTKSRESKDIVRTAAETVTNSAASNNAILNAVSFNGVAPKDAWGQDLIYLYDGSFASATPSKDTICGRRSTGITIVNSNIVIGALPQTINNVAFLVLSRGDNTLVDAAATDGPITVSRTAAGTVTLDASALDIVSWVTLDDLRSKVGCQGSQLRIVNNEMPSATVNAQYPNAAVGSNLAIIADGASTQLSWCMETTAPLTGPPSGLAFTPPPSVPPLGKTCNQLPEGSWKQSSTLSIAGTPTAAGSYGFTIFVRDNSDVGGSNDNIASKTFVITVNP